MDSNLWSLLHIVFPLCLCGLQNDIIYVYLEEGRPFYLYSMPVASVPVYLWKTAVSLLCCIFYKLEL